MRSRIRLSRFLLPFLTLAALPPASVAQLVWEQRSIEIDAPPGQREAVVVFPFRNAGEREIAINAVRPRSGVVEAKATADSVAAGAKGAIEAVVPIDPRRREEKGSIRVSTNDPDEGTVELRYVVRVAESIRIGVRVVRWDLGAPNAGIEEQVVKVQVDPASGIKLGKVRAVPGGFVTRLEEGEKDGEFLVHVRPESVAGPTRARIEIETVPPMASARLNSFMAVVGPPPERRSGRDAGKEGEGSDPAPNPAPARE